MSEHYLQIETDIPGDAQESSFMNATLTSLASGLAVSIAVTAADHLQDMSQDELAAALREEFMPLAQVGYLVEIKIGPDHE